MKISIITVSYNSEKTIERTIQSVLSQTYDNIEYIIVDGKSEDGTIAIVNKYRSRIKRIVSEEDRGIYDAMNKGSELATGEWLLFLNSDDYLCADTVVGNVISEIEMVRQDVHLVYGKTWYHFPSIGKTELGGRAVKKTDFYFEQAIAHCSCFFKTEKFREVGLYTLAIRGAADFEWYLRFFSKYDERNVYFISEPITIFQDGGASFRFLWDNYKDKRELSKKYFPWHIALLYSVGSPVYWLKYKLLWFMNNIALLGLYKKWKYAIVALLGKKRSAGKKTIRVNQ